MNTLIAFFQLEEESQRRRRRRRRRSRSQEALLPPLTHTNTHTRTQNTCIGLAGLTEPLSAD
jgi:hypothetical protein